MTATGHSHLTLNLDPHMQGRLRIAASRKGLQVEHYCRQAIEYELARDEEQQGDASQQPLSVADLARLRKEQFGSRVFPGDSVDLIREAREIRDAQMDEW